MRSISFWKLKTREEDIISLSFDSLYKKNPDCTINILEALIRTFQPENWKADMRYDLNNSQMNTAIAACKQMYEQRKQKLSPEGAAKTGAVQ